jgi:hypothetical protein
MTPSKTRGSPHAFILRYRRALERNPGIKPTVVKAFAQEAYKEDYREYVAAINRGEQLPPLDRKPDFEKRLARAIATGGVING